MHALKKIFANKLSSLAQGLLVHILRSLFKNKQTNIRSDVHSIVQQMQLARVRKVDIRKTLHELIAKFLDAYEAVEGFLKRVPA